MTNHQWWKTDLGMIAAVREYGSPTRAAIALGGISDRGARKAFKRMQDGANSAPFSGLEKPVDAGSQISDTNAVIVSRESELASKGPEDLLREHGLDPLEWSYKFSTRSWEMPIGEGEVGVMHQARVDAVKRPEALLGFTIPKGWKPRAPKKRKESSKPILKVVFPDPHEPLGERTLIEASVAWLEDFQPVEVYLLGDTVDNSPFKRHKKNRRIDCSPEEAFWSGYELLARWRNAAPDARIRMLFGNHDHWWYDRLNELFPMALDFRAPGEELPHNSLAKILHLDELRIEYEETGGEYHDVFAQIVEDLVGMHGTKTGPRGGSVKEQSGWEGASVVQGHDHRVSLNAITKRTSDGGHAQRYAMSAGTMARHDLGYNPTHDVGQGFMVFTVWPDGRWHPSFALYDPVRDDVVWNDWRYAA